MQKNIITSAQDFTGDWVNLGEPVQAINVNRLALWLDIDINDTLNARVRARAKLGKNDSELYNIPVERVADAITLVDEQYFEINADADQKAIVSWNLYGLVPYVQFQISAGTAGATAGQVLSAIYSESQTFN